MTRHECEKAIEAKMREIVAIMHAYSPKSTYIALCYINDEGDNYIGFNNRSYDETSPDYETPIEYSVHDELEED